MGAFSSGEAAQEDGWLIHLGNVIQDNLQALPGLQSGHVIESHASLAASAVLANSRTDRVGFAVLHNSSSRQPTLRSKLLVMRLEGCKVVPEGLMQDRALRVQDECRA